MTEEQTTQPASDNNSTSTKVFVGNLSFRTRGPGLREAFEAAGKVEGVRVVTQGRRSMGYGFVQFALLDEAKKAVELLHKQPLDGREINVEISTSSNTGLNPVKRRRPRTRKAKTDSPAETTEEAETAPTAATTPTGEAPKKKPRRRAPKRKARAAGATEEGATATEGTPAPEGTTQPRKAKAPRKPRAPREPREAGEPREPRQAREPREPREFSDTVLYVSNIPFALEDAGLIEAFKEFEPTSANIIRRNRTNLSKGFGFVEFADAAKQQAALDAKHKSKLGDREITVRKAHIRPPTDEASTTANATTSESVETKTE